MSVKHVAIFVFLVNIVLSQNTLTNTPSNSISTTEAPSQGNQTSTTESPTGTTLAPTTNPAPTPLTPTTLAPTAPLTSTPTPTDPTNPVTAAPTTTSAPKETTSTPASQAPTPTTLAPTTASSSTPAPALTTAPTNPVTVAPTTTSGPKETTSTPLTTVPSMTTSANALTTSSPTTSAPTPLTPPTETLTPTSTPTTTHPTLNPISTPSSTGMVPSSTEPMTGKPEPDHSNTTSNATMLPNSSVTPSPTEINTSNSTNTSFPNSSVISTTNPPNTTNSSSSNVANVTDTPRKSPSESPQPTSLVPPTEVDWNWATYSNETTLLRPIRFGKSMVTSNANVTYLFGGFNTNGSGVFFSDVLTVRVEGSYLPVDVVSPKTPSPNGRMFHAATIYEEVTGSMMIIHGGIGANGVLGDTNGFVFSSWFVWNAPSGPGSLHSHNMVSLPWKRSFLVLFGSKAQPPGIDLRYRGEDNTTLQGDVWEYQFSKKDGTGILQTFDFAGSWRRCIVPQAASSMRRRGAAVVLVNKNSVFIFGGFTVMNGGGHYALNDMYLLNTDTWEFTPVLNRAQYIKPRAYAAITVGLANPQYIFLFGGLSEDGPENALQALEIIPDTQIQESATFRFYVGVQNTNITASYSSNIFIIRDTYLVVLPSNETKAYIAVVGENTLPNASSFETRNPVLTPKPTSAEEYFPTIITAEGAVAVGGSATSGASAIFEIVMGGSLTAPLVVCTQLQFMVMMGNLTCASPEAKELVVGMRPFLKPLRYDAVLNASYSWDAGNLLGSLLFIFAFMCVYLILLFFVKWYKEEEDWTVIMSLCYFPNGIFLPLLLLAPGMAHSASTLIFNDTTAEGWKALAIIVLLGFHGTILLYVCGFIYVHFIAVSSNSQPFVELMRRNLGNDENNMKVLIHGSRNAKSIPNVVAYFLPVGYWSSKHLPDRTFTKRYSFLFEEYVENSSWFMCLHVLKIFLQGILFGSGCRQSALIWNLIITSCYTMALVIMRPYRSKGSSIIHITVSFLNLFAMMSLYVEVFHKVQVISVHTLMLFTAYMMLFTSIWNGFLLVLGFVMRKKEMEQAATNATHRSFNVEMSLVDNTLTPPQSVMTGTLEHRVLSTIPLFDLCNRGWQVVYVEIQSDSRMFVYNESTLKEGSRMPDFMMNLGLGTFEISADISKHTFTLTNRGINAVHQFRANLASGAITEEDWCTWYEKLYETVSQTSRSHPFMRGAGLQFDENTEDEYEHLALLGRGAYGKVNKVRHIKTNKIYAMKIYDQEKMVGSLARALMEEASVMQVIKHPFIVGLVSAFQQGRHVYLVMPLLSGGDLSMHLSRAPKGFSEQVARFFAGEIFLGLEHLHENNIMYRDLKPQNVVIDGEGHPVLTDLGFATRVEVSQHFVGTPLYVAPEIIARKTYTKAVDWWAYGILVFEMLTGHVPYRGANQADTFELISNAEVPFPTDGSMSESAIDLVSKLLRKNPLKRLTNPRDIRKHPFFEKFDFKKAARKRLVPPPMDSTMVPTMSADDEDFKQGLTLTNVSMMFERKGKGKGALRAEVDTSYMQQMRGAMDVQQQQQYSDAQTDSVGKLYAEVQYLQRMQPQAPTLPIPHDDSVSQLIGEIELLKQNPLIREKIVEPKDFQQPTSPSGGEMMMRPLLAMRGATPNRLRPQQVSTMSSSPPASGMRKMTDSVMELL